MYVDLFSQKISEFMNLELAVSSIAMIFIDEIDCLSKSLIDALRYTI